MRHTGPVRYSALAASLVLGSLSLTAAPAAAVTGPATPSGDTTSAYAAQIIIGDHDRGCSGVLVDAEWLLTAASCFVDDPAAGLDVPAGKPAAPTTATIGSGDLTGSSGAVRDIVELVPRTDRDVVLARLDRPVTDVAPVSLATSEPAAGEDLKFTGYGRTGTEWAPLNPHTGVFSVAAATATTASVTGEDGVSACMGDTGGPLVRTSAGVPQLVALVSRSYQGGCFGIDEAETRTGGEAARVDDLASWVNAKVGAPRITDFNCDGVEDIAIADPAATVAGGAKAGVVRVVYGGGKGTAAFDQSLDWITGDAEAGDGFGSALATLDYDADGCTDLVVGTPNEDLGTATDAGVVDILHGARAGVGSGTTKITHFEQGMGNASLAASASETGDLLGYSLAAGTTAAGEPYVLMGLPGEGLGSAQRAGSVIYAHSGTNAAINQSMTGSGAAPETGDAFGTSLAADGNRIAVGVPGEAVGTVAAAGLVAVFDQKLNSEKRPTPMFNLTQNSEGVSGGSETGDRYGQAVAMVPYRATATGATDSILAVGTPNEALTIDGVNKPATGSVHTFRITAAGTRTQLAGFSSGTATDDVSGTAEAGDHFGQYLAAVNTAPHAVGTTATMKLAVGAPDEALVTTAAAGAVSTFSLLGAPGANDRWLEVGDGDGIPGTPGANQRLGSSLHYTGTSLYVGMPDGPSGYGTLYSLPLSNVTAGGAVAPVTTYQPGTGGLPPSGDRFGHAAR